MINISFQKNHSNSNSDMYHRSRQLFIIESCVGSTAYNLTTGAFIAGLALYLGANDWFNGLLGVIPMMAGMAQILAPLILERKKRRKPVTVAFMSVYKLMITLVVFIPLIVSSQHWRLTLLMICVIFAYFCLNVVWPGFSTWLSDVVPEKIRGRYFGVKDSYSLAVVTVISLTMGFILDSFKPQGSDTPVYAGFVTVFCFSLVLAVINILVLFKIKEPETAREPNTVRLSECFAKPLGNKLYMKVVVFFILWNVGLNIGAPFLPVYQVKYLHLEYKYIMLLNLLSNATMVIAVRRWGKFADKYNWAHSASLSIGVLAFTHFAWGFATEKTLFMLPIIFILNGSAWAGINISLFNLPFIFVPEENKTIYLGFNAAVGGVSGLIATLAGGQLVNMFEGVNFKIGSFGICGIQGIVFVSSLLLVFCSLFGASRLVKSLDKQKG